MNNIHNLNQREPTDAQRAAASAVAKEAAQAVLEATRAKMIPREVLLRRINRRLAREEGGIGNARQVRTSRGERQRSEFGDYYAERNNFIVDSHVDLEHWGRNLRVLSHREYVW